MVSKNNKQLREQLFADRSVPHYSLRKLGIGVVSVLLGTTMYFGANTATANAATVADNSGNGNTTSNTSDATAQTNLNAQQVNLSQRGAAGQVNTSTKASTTTSQVPQNNQAIAGDTGAAQDVQQVSSNAQSNGVTANQTPDSMARSITSASTAKTDANQGNTQSSSNANLQPVTANNSENKNSTTDPKVATLGQLNFYYYAVQYADPGKGNTLYTIPFTWDGNGKLAVINLNDYKDKIIAAINAKQTEGSNKVTDITFKDSSNHYITSVDPNALGNNASIVPIYVTSNIQSDYDSEYGNLDDAQKALDTIVLSQKGINKSVSYNNDGISGAWGIRTPDEALADGVPYEPTGVDAYSPDEVRQMVDSQYIKVNVDSANSDYPSGAYYIPITSIYSYFNEVSFPQFIKNYEALVNGSRSIQLKSDDNLDAVLGEYFLGSSSDSMNAIDQAKFDTVYANALQQDKDNRENNLSWRNSAGYEIPANGNNDGSVLLPEYDANNKKIDGKYAGRVFIYGTSSNLATLHVVYIPFDANYTGKLNSLYLITGAGSNGSTRGFLTINAEQKRQAIIKYIDDTTKTNLKTDQATGDLGTQIDFATTPSQQIQTYEDQGYTLVSNDFQDNPTYKDANANNVFYVHLIHDTEPVTKSVTVTRTIHYVGADQQTPPDVEQPITFTASGVRDKVTGKWTTPLTWSPDQTFANVTTPIITGYHVVSVDKDSTDNRNVDSEPVKNTDKSYTVTVTYAKDPVVQTQNASLKVIDETTGQQIASYTDSGLPDTAINFGSAQSDIQNYLNHGYRWDATKTTNRAKDYAGLGIKNFDNDSATPQTWTVYLVHATIHVDKDHPGHGYTPEQLTKTVTTTVNYVTDDGTVLTTPVKDSATFEGSGDYDNVTKAWVTVDQDGNITGVANGLTWTPETAAFDAIPAKTFDGYDVSRVYGIADPQLHVDYNSGAVDSQTVTPTSINSNITVVYTKHQVAPVETTGSVTYVDDSENQTPLEMASFGGNVGDKINYTTADRIAYWESLGYKLNGTNPFHDGSQVYAQNPADNTFVIHLIHTTTHVDKDHPGNGYTPEQLTKTVTTTVNYVTNDGTVLTTPVTNSATFEGSGDYDNVTKAWVTVDQNGNITGAANGLTWTPTTKSFNAIPAKNFTGYNLKSVGGNFDQNLQVNFDTGAIGAQTMTPTTSDSTITVVYTKAPENLQLARVQYIDLDNNNQVLSESGQLTGKSGAVINYSTADEITALENQGYVLAKDGFPAGTTFDNVDGNEQLFKVTFHHGVSPVDPNHPGAGYTSDQLQKDVTRTIHYINALTGQSVADAVPQTSHFTANGYVDNVTHQLVNVNNGQITGPGQLAWSPDQNLAKIISPTISGMHVGYITRDADGNDVKEVTIGHGDDSYDVYVNYVQDGQATKNGQSIPASQTIHFVDDNGNPLHSDVVENSQFTRTPDVVDSITGQTITTGTWNKTSHRFDTVDVPVIPGYVAEVRTSGGLTATTDQPNVSATVVYHKIGKIIPVDQNGTPIPNAPTPTYTNDPNDPTRVTPDEPTPTITGWTTQTPTVTPVKPTEDTPVIYTQPITEDQHASVTYIDRDENDREIANSGDLTGKAGTRINYSTTQTINDLISKGYKVYYNGFDYDGQNQTFDNDDQHDQVFTVILEHTQSPVNTEHPNAKVDPSWYTKQVTSTVHYTGAGDQTPTDNVQKVIWHRTLTIDNVTGQIVDHGQYDQDWTPSQTNYDAVVTPTVTGYTPDQSVVPAKEVTMNDRYTVVSYNKQMSTDNSTQPQPNQPADKGDNGVTNTDTNGNGSVGTSQMQPVINNVSDTGLGSTGKTTVATSQNNTSTTNIALPQTGNDEQKQAEAAGIIGVTMTAGLLGLAALRKRHE